MEQVRHRLQGWVLVVGVVEKEQVQRTKTNLGLVGMSVNQEAWLHGGNHTHGSVAGAHVRIPPMKQQSQFSLA
jgi:hypothetical protein